jgi:hypothetical protein
MSKDYPLSKKRRLPLGSIFLLLIFSIGTVWLRLLVVRLAYSIDEVHQWMGRSKRKHDQLQLELVEMKSPSQLKELARTRFHRMQPHAKQVIYLKSSPSRDP